MRGKAIMSTVLTATQKTTGFLDLDIFRNLSEIHLPTILDEPGYFLACSILEGSEKKLGKILEFQLL